MSIKNHHYQVIKSPLRSTTLSNLPEAGGGFGLHSPRWPEGWGGLMVAYLSLSRLLTHPREECEWSYSALPEPQGESYTQDNISVTKYPLLNMGLPNREIIAKASLSLHRDLFQSTHAWGEK